MTTKGLPEDGITQMFLPVSYEEATTLFSKETLIQKLMDFVVPLEREEERIIKHLRRASSSGKIVFLYGAPGSGKSTFIESLGWRRHIGLRKLLHVNAADYLPPSGLNEVLGVVRDAASQAAKERDVGPTALVLDYLENLDGYEDNQVRGFYRALNGILRPSPILVIWPVVSLEDARRMIAYSEGISGTMFTKGEEIIEFEGPPLDRFVSIAETTIEVVNSGKKLTDFSLTRGDLEDVLEKVEGKTQADRVIRRYLEQVKDVWTEKSGYLASAVSKIPKFSEVWFVICHNKAEDVVKQFARRGENTEDAWLANHDSLYEYVKGTQRAGYWSARKLQMAINGVLKTRILFLPTNCVVAAITAYSTNDEIRDLVLQHGGSKNWTQKNRVLQYFESTPLYRQLDRRAPLIGKRKSGPGVQAINLADPAFTALNAWLASEKGHDSVINTAIAAMLSDKLGLQFDAIEVGKPHPWIPNVIPDIRLDPRDGRRHINLEFHFTNNKQPNVVADYCLRKMQVYLQQVEHYLSLAD